MKGPMTTQTLRGLLNLSPYHWRGDQIDFAAFNSTFDALMGSSQISDSDMKTYTAFINSILYLPNPNQNLDRTLPTSLANGNPGRGQSDFLTIPGTGSGNTCDSCHKSNPGPGSNRLIIPDFTPQPMKISHLRNMYQKQLYTRHDAESIDGFGFAHDGDVSGLLDFLAKPAFKKYTSQQKIDIAAYVLCFDTGTAPAVGFTITLTAANVNNQQEQKDWATLQSQAEAGNIDLIARGTTQGEVHGLLYQPKGGQYDSDTDVKYSRTQLQTFIQNEDTLSFMGVYPGTGSAH